MLGYGEYPDDVEMEGMVYASAVRSQYPRARVLDIDCGKAAALPACWLCLRPRMSPITRWAISSRTGT